MAEVIDLTQLDDKEPSPPPPPPPPRQKKKRARDEGSDDDVEITGVRGDDTLRTAPHARFDCVVCARSRQ